MFAVVSGAVARVEFGVAGTGTLGRYLLPLVVITVLTAGEVLRQHHHRLGVVSPRHLVAGVAVTAAVCQTISLWMAGRAIGCCGIAAVGLLATAENRRLTPRS